MTDGVISFKSYLLEIFNVQVSWWIEVHWLDSPLFYLFIFGDITLRSKSLVCAYQSTFNRSETKIRLQPNLRPRQWILDWTTETLSSNWKTGSHKRRHFTSTLTRPNLPTTPLLFMQTISGSSVLCSQGVLIENFLDLFVPIYKVYLPFSVGLFLSVECRVL